MLRTRDSLKRVKTAAKLLNVSRHDPDGVALIRRVRRNRLTFLDSNALLDLRERAKQVDNDGVDGAILEMGTALGGSAIVLAGSKADQRPLEVYDVFGMIPPPSEKDGEDVIERYEVIKDGKAEGFAGDTYYGYEPDLKRKVAASFSALGYPPEENAVTFHEGLFEDTLNPSAPVALAHVDGDWYESVKVCLDRIWPALAPGGAMVIDDYDHWSGCRDAVDEFLDHTPDADLERHTRLHIVKPR